MRRSRTERAIAWAATPPSERYIEAHMATARSHERLGAWVSAVWAESVRVGVNGQCRDLHAQAVLEVLRWREGKGSVFEAVKAGNDYARAVRTARRAA